MCLTSPIYFIYYYYYLLMPSKLMNERGGTCDLVARKFQLMETDAAKPISFFLHLT